MNQNDSLSLRPALQVRDLCKSVGSGSARRLLLDHVSFDLAAGEAVALLGSSGSGKTSLLNIVGGLDRADAGTLLVQGQALDWQQVGLDRYRRHQVGIVFQFYNLIASMTVQENVLSGAEAAGMALNASDASALLAELGLQGREAAFPADLSGGEQQRVAIARALVKKPALLLADEPTGNLDATSGERVCAALLERARKAKTALLVVTHNEALAARFDRVLHLNDGRLRSPLLLQPPPQSQSLPRPSRSSEYAL
jgi:putative ABC transport system ATP-binding protein